MLTRLLAVAGLAIVIATPRMAAEVVVKESDKVAKAKVGDVVNIQIANPALANMKSDFKVDETGKAVDKAKLSDENRKSADGKTLAGGGYKSIKLKATAKGKELVKVTWMQYGNSHKAEFEIDVQ
jgi:hypothetical protein